MKQGFHFLKSIRWRIVLIYVLLVSIAMTVAGVFLISELEDYMMEDVRSRFTKIVQENILTLQNYEDLGDHQEQIRNDILAWSESLREELFVIDESFTIIASGNENYLDQNALNLLDQSVLVQAFNGRTAEVDQILSSGVPVKNLVFPIQNGEEVIGIICLRADISNVFAMQDQAQKIFLYSLAMALVVTVLLAYLISRSITVPISDVSEKVEKMAQGDFSQEVQAKSDDEIGQLAQMFNLLRGELDLTLSTITNEKNKLETILEYMADGLLAIDKDTRKVLLVNPMAIRMLGLSIREGAEPSYEDVEAEFGPELAFDTMWEKSEEGGNHSILEHKGHIFSLRYDRFKDDADADVGLILLLQDITEQQKMENMQRDFVANVSHELKTPLTTIKSYTETLLDGMVTDEETAKSFLSIVDTEADRMNRLVRELLQLSRLDHKQEKWAMKEADLLPLLKSCVTKMEMTAKQKEQTVTAELPADEAFRVVMDKDRMEQVILNIISNSIKYTQEGGSIRISLREESADSAAGAAFAAATRAIGRSAGKVSGWVCVDVADNGIGIPEEDQPRIFERFYRVDKAHSRKMGGTGLGLSIAKQIMEGHGGGIQLESKLGEGTRVTLYLPAAPTRGMRDIE
ncbi:MAG: HAMP domain-containing protein [Firmicutes bacterium]|nr:HAMP domain-containing protein [Bacillota bacterium]